MTLDYLPQGASEPYAEMMKTLLTGGKRTYTRDAIGRFSSTGGGGGGGGGGEPLTSARVEKMSETEALNYFKKNAVREGLYDESQVEWVTKQPDAGGLAKQALKNSARARENPVPGGDIGIPARKITPQRMNNYWQNNGGSVERTLGDNKRMFTNRMQSFEGRTWSQVTQTKKGSFLEDYQRQPWASEAGEMLWPASALG